MLPDPSTKTKVAFLAITLLLALFTINAYAVPVAPNEAVFIGTVKGCDAYQDNGQMGYILKIFVEETDNISGKLNLIENELGKEIVAYTIEDIPQGILGRRIKGKIRYQGDERGGRYWVFDIHVEGASGNPNK